MLSFSQPAPDFSQPHVPDEIMVAFMSGASKGAQQAVETALSALSHKPAFGDVPDQADAVEVFKLPPGLTVADAYARVEKMPSIAYVSPLFLETGPTPLKEWPIPLGHEELPIEAWSRLNLPDKVQIWFQPSDSESERQRAVALVSGTVEESNDKGCIVRLPEGVSAWKAILRLRLESGVGVDAMPQPREPLPTRPVVDLSLPHASDMLVVRFLPDTPSKEIDEVIGTLLQGTVHSSLPNVGDAERAEGKAIGESFLVQLPKEVTVADALARLKDVAAIEHAYPEYVYQTTAVPNDPGYTWTQHWGAWGDLTTPTNQFGSQASEAWLADSTGSADVVVAVLDTGVDRLHQELVNNMWQNPLDPWDGVDNDGNGRVDDTFGWNFFNNNGNVDAGDPSHGTAVAGVIGARGGNGIGMAGTAWNTRIIALKVGDDIDIGLDFATQAINYLVGLHQAQPNLRIVAINGSFGGTTYYAPLEAAIRNAADHGILFIAAAGNAGSNNDVTPQFPASYSTWIPGQRAEHVIAVNALRSVGTLPTWSNFGAASVDLAAPGGDGLGEPYTNDIISTCPSEGHNAYYYGVAGTSPAAAYVTGAAALYAAAHPNANGEAIRGAIFVGASQTPTAGVTNYFGGRLNVGAMFSPSTIGLYNPGTPSSPASEFLLNYTNRDGFADRDFGYGWTNHARTPIAGNWEYDWNRVATIGLYDPTTSWFHLRNSNSTGVADLAFGYGVPNAGWTPLAGDWNGDRVDTIGLYRPDIYHFWLRNSNSTGMVDIDVGFGGFPGQIPLIGDWNGDKIDTIGVYNPESSYFYLRNSNTTGVADVTFGFGPPGGGWIPVAGDWNGDGVDTVGLYRPGTSTFYFRNSLTTGGADFTQPYGFAGATPLIGDFEGRGALPQYLLAEGAPKSPVSQPPLDEKAISPLVAEAIARWELAAPGSQVVLRSVSIVVTDLPGAQLGMAQGNTIYLDRDAAGFGWFIDATPWDDQEFDAASGRANGVDPDALDRIDLLSVVEHELGHLRGLGDLHSELDDVMSGTLRGGIRRA